MFATNKDRKVYVGSVVQIFTDQGEGDRPAPFLCEVVQLGTIPNDKGQIAIRTNMLMGNSGSQLEAQASGGPILFGEPISSTSALLPLSRIKLSGVETYHVLPDLSYPDL